MSKGKKRRQKGEYTRPQHTPPAPPAALPPHKAERVRHVSAAYILLLCVRWGWDVEDVKDVPILRAATTWTESLRWPRSLEELWDREPLLQPYAESSSRREGRAGA
jgi:hypothetical protein